MPSKSPLENERYGCWNRASQPSYTAQDGWRYTIDEAGAFTRFPTLRIYNDPFVDATCQYRERTDDSKCVGCRERSMADEINYKLNADAD